MKAKKLIPFPKKYFNMMPPPAVVEVLKKSPWLTWWVKDKDSISLPFAVESILNYGNWDQAKTLFRTAGIKKVKRVFNAQTRNARCNYYPDVKEYFKLYFKRHAA